MTSAASLQRADKDFGIGMSAEEQSRLAERKLTEAAWTEARAALRALSGRVGDKSNLILDPDLDSYYEMDLMLLKVPDILDRASDLALASQRSFADGELSTEERLDLLVRMGGLQSVIDGAQASIDSAYSASADGSVKAALDSSYSAYKQALAAVAGQWVSRVPAAGEVQSAIAALSRFYDAVSADLERLLEKRIAGFSAGQMQVLAIEAILFVLAVGLVLFIATRSVIKPVRQITGLMSRLAEGQLDVDINLGARRDEVGDMAMALQIFQQNLIENKRLEAEEARKSRREAQRAESLSRLFAEFEGTFHGITGAVSNSSGQMRSFAEGLHRSADDVNRRSGSVAAASEQAAANVSTVAAATEELSASIQEITRQVGDSSRTTKEAVAEARHTNQTVGALASAAGRIGEVVQLISEIANQTNLLALNATIEAARAGEAGKGFAVVASEVKNLATQTAKATEDITAQIAAMQGVANDAVKAIGGIGATIEKINGISSAIAAAVEQQGAATSEISRNVQEAAVGTRDVSTNISSVSEVAEETTGVATQVLDAATALSDEARRLETEVADFIERIRAA